MKKTIILAIMILLCGTTFAELWGSGSASTLIVQDAGDEDAAYYVALWDSVTGALVGKTDTGITYNPDANSLTLAGDFTVGSNAFDVDSANMTVGIGTAATADSLLTVTRTATVTTDQSGLVFTPIYTVSAPNLDFTAARFGGQLSVSDANDVDNLFGIKTGLFTGASFEADLTNAFGLYSEMGFSAPGRGESTITNVRHINLLDPTVDPTVDITTLIAFYMEEMTAASTSPSGTPSGTDWQIYSVGGASYFGGTDGLYLGQVDGAEKISSDADGTLDLYAGTSVNLGNPGTTDLKVEADGDTFWVGDGTGLPYGSVKGSEIGWSQASAAQNTWYEISDSTMADGQLNNITHDGNGQLTIGIAGMYNCTWHVSSEVDASSQHIQITFSVNGTEVADGENHYESFGTSKQFPISGGGILDLGATDTLEVSIRTTDSGTPNISVDHLHIIAIQVGGT